MNLGGAARREKSAIAGLAQKCLDARGENREAWERGIDEIVARLYGLTDDETAIVEGKR